MIVLVVESKDLDPHKRIVFGPFPDPDEAVIYGNARFEDRKWSIHPVNRP